MVSLTLCVWYITLSTLTANIFPHVLTKTHFLAIMAVIRAVDTDRDTGCVLLVKYMGCYVLVSCLLWQTCVCLNAPLWRSCCSADYSKERKRDGGMEQNIKIRPRLDYSVILSRILSASLSLCSSLWRNVLWLIISLARFIHFKTAVRGMWIFRLTQGSDVVKGVIAGSF